MPTVTRSRLRRLLGQNIGFFFAGTTSGAGAADGSTVVDSDIQRFNTNLLAGKWVLITSGTASGESQRISSVSTSTITMVVAFSAQIANTVTFEIMEYDPTSLDWALQEAGRALAPHLWLPLRNETLIVDNLVLNPLFVNGTFTSWTSIGSPTITANTSYFWHGSQSANIAPAAANEGLKQNLLTVANGYARIDQAVGKTLNVRAALRATNVSNARLRVTFDGTTYTNGSFHSGDDDWEGPTVHQVQVAIPASPSEMTVSVEGATTTAFQAGMVVAWISPITRYTIPSTFYPYGPARLSMQEYIDRPNGLYLPLGIGNPPQPGHLLRLEGEGRITVPTTDAGTMELDEPQGELLVAEAAHLLFGLLKNSDPGGRQRFQVDEGAWRQRKEQVLARPSLRRLPLSAHKHTVWSTTEDATDMYLLLNER